MIVITKVTGKPDAKSASVVIEDAKFFAFEAKTRQLFAFETKEDARRSNYIWKADVVVDGTPDRVLVLPEPDEVLARKFWGNWATGKDVPDEIRSFRGAGATAQLQLID